MIWHLRPRASVRLVIVGLAAVTMSIGGCQGKKPTGLRLTPVQYKERVNRICADAANITSTIAPPTAESTTQDFGLYAQQLRQVLGPHVRAIEDIPVPPALRPGMLRLNDLFNGLLRSLADEVSAGRSNDGPRLVDISKRIKDQQHTLSVEANALGLTSCSSE